MFIWTAKKSSGRTNWLALLFIAILVVVQPGAATAAQTTKKNQQTSTQNTNASAQTKAEKVDPHRADIADKSVGAKNDQAPFVAKQNGASATTETNAKAAAGKAGGSFKNEAEARVQAENLGYRKLKGRLMNTAAVYENRNVPRGLRYISRDKGSNNEQGSHNGGAWKAASSVKALRNKRTRTGTFNADLTQRIGD